MHTAIERERVTDEELMSRFQAGDVQAMEQLFARYQKPLFNFFYRMLGRREAAEDMVQETFLKLCRFGSSFRGSSAKFSTWLYSVAGNQCRDHLRHTARRPEIALGEYEQNVSDGDPESLDPIPYTGESPVEDHVIRMELQEKLKAAVDSLPKKERTAILLREYQGLEYKDIAQILGCPLGSVKVLIFRARQRLRTRLGDLDEM
jgi:RNA polymerase sigma-70 factor, ECF subfamily